MARSPWHAPPGACLKPYKSIARLSPPRLADPSGRYGERHRLSSEYCPRLWHKHFFVCPIDFSAHQPPPPGREPSTNSSHAQHVLASPHREPVPATRACSRHSSWRRANRPEEPISPKRRHREPRTENREPRTENREPTARPSRQRPNGPVPLSREACEGGTIKGEGCERSELVT
jgi:hypothetical protein